MFNVADFRSSILSANLQKPSKFRVRVFIPASVNVSPTTGRSLEFWAESAILPMFMASGGMAARWGYGTPEYRHTVPIFDTVSIILIADADGNNHRLFTDWLNTITNADSGGSDVFEIGYRQDIVSEVEIDLFKETGELSMTVLLEEALPVAIGNVKLDWADNNAYMRLPIEFRFWKWRRL